MRKRNVDDDAVVRRKRNLRASVIVGGIAASFIFGHPSHPTTGVTGSSAEAAHKIEITNHSHEVMLGLQTPIAEKQRSLQRSRIVLKILWLGHSEELQRHDSSQEVAHHDHE